MKNAIIEILDKKVCSIDEGTKEEINLILVKFQDSDALDIAIEISNLDYFATLEVDSISVMIEEIIIEWKEKEASTLKGTIINRAEKFNIGTDKVTSNQLIEMFTDEVFHYGFTQKEIHDAQHYIKEVIKSEIVADLDKQIDTFKHFLKRS